MHPLPSAFDIEEENDDAPLTIPEHHMSDEEVEMMFVDYSTRAPEDWVISGPLGTHGRGPGRRFDSMSQAWRWARNKYGPRLKGRIAEATLFGGNRWAFLIRGERVRSDS